MKLTPSLPSFCFLFDEEREREHKNELKNLSGGGKERDGYGQEHQKF